jgi:hypothetical protein
MLVMLSPFRPLAVIQSAAGHDSVWVLSHGDWHQWLGAAMAKALGWLVE